MTPDNFMVDKVLRSITRRTISDKHIEHRLDDGDQVIEAEVEAERRTAPCLTDAEVQAVAALARLAEKHFGCPQDVEWALDDQLPDGENVLLLQSRPGDRVEPQGPRSRPARGRQLSRLDRPHPHGTRSPARLDGELKGGATYGTAPAPPGGPQADGVHVVLELVRAGGNQQ